MYSVWVFGATPKFHTHDISRSSGCSLALRVSSIPKSNPASPFVVITKSVDTLVGAVATFARLAVIVIAALRSVYVVFDSVNLSCVASGCGVCFVILIAPTGRFYTIVTFLLSVVDAFLRHVICVSDKLILGACCTRR